MLCSICVFCGKMSIQVFCPFLKIWSLAFFLLRCISYLCILDVNTLPVIYLQFFFSIQFIVFSFGWWFVSYAVHILFSLTRSPLFIFAFTSFTVGDTSKNAIYVKEYLAYVFFYEFYCFHSYTRVFKLFWVHFSCGVKECFNFIVL